MIADAVKVAVQSAITRGEQSLGGDERRDRPTGGRQHRVGGPEHERDDEQVPDGLRAADAEHDQRQRAQPTPTEKEPGDATAIETVGHPAADEDEQQCRDELGEADERDVERVAGEVEDLLEQHGQQHVLADRCRGGRDEQESNRGELQHLVRRGGRAHRASSSRATSAAIARNRSAAGGRVRPVADQLDRARWERRLETVDADVGIVVVDGERRHHRPPHPGSHHRLHRCIVAEAECVVGNDSGLLEPFVDHPLHGLDAGLADERLAAQVVGAHGRAWCCAERSEHHERVVARGPRSSGEDRRRCRR